MDDSRWRSARHTPAGLSRLQDRTVGNACDYCCVNATSWVWGAARRDLPARPWSPGQPPQGVSKPLGMAAKRLLAPHPHKPRRARHSTGPRFPNRPSPPPEDICGHESQSQTPSHACDLTYVNRPACLAGSRRRCESIRRLSASPVASLVRRLEGGNGKFLAELMTRADSFEGEIHRGRQLKTPSVVATTGGV